MSNLDGVTPVNQNEMPEGDAQDIQGDSTNGQEGAYTPSQSTNVSQGTTDPNTQENVQQEASQEVNNTPAQDDSSESDTKTSEFVPTGNEVLDSAAALVSKAGFDPIALHNELENGLTQETRAQLEGKLGKEQTSVLIRSVSSEIETQRNKVKETLSSVHSTVGGEQTWNSIVEWSRTEEAGLDPKAAEEYNAMLNAGGVQAQLAARALKEAYMSSPGFKEQNPTMEQADSSAPASPSLEPISRPQYTEEYNKAIRAGDAAKAAALDARAKYTMQHYPQQWRVLRLN